MRDRFRLECSKQQDHRVDLSDVSEEAIPQSFTSMGTADQPGDVNEPNLSPDDTLGLQSRDERIKPRIGEQCDAEILIDRRERMACGGRVGLRQGVEQR
jgi:hypothetical protein